jgi:hypothetical protein
VISEEDFAEAASAADPTMAFVRLETRFRGVLHENLNRAGSNYGRGEAISEYMNHTITVAESLGLNFLDSFEVPHPNDSGPSDELHEFTKMVDSFKVRARLAHIRSPIEYSVGLAGSDKEKIRFSCNR